MGQQTNNPSTSKAVANSTPSEKEYDEEQFVSLLNNTKKIFKKASHFISTFVLDVGNSCTRTIKGVERQLRIERLFIGK